MQNELMLDGAKDLYLRNLNQFRHSHIDNQSEQCPLDQKMLGRIFVSCYQKQPLTFLR